jgi:hypothetical protein
MARAIKVWVSISYFGVDAFRRAIERSIDLAQRAEERIRSSPRLELLTPASLGVVAFRRAFEGVDDDGLIERMNGEVVRRLVESGRGLVSSTRLRGRFAIRMCVMNHTSGAEDIDEVLDWIENVDVERPAGPARAPADEREPGVRQPWLERRSADAIDGLELFGGLDEEQRGRLRASSWETVVPPDTQIVQAWEFAREFYVILEGTVSVMSDDQEIASLGPGDFFGEVAALEWGAGYGYPRTASVVASSVAHLLVVPGSLLNELVRDAPAFGDIIRRTMSERLSGS